MRDSRDVRSRPSRAISWRSRGDRDFGRTWAHAQRQKSKFAPFPIDGELHVDDPPLDLAHGSRYVQQTQRQISCSAIRLYVYMYRLKLVTRLFVIDPVSRSGSPRRATRTRHAHGLSPESRDVRSFHLRFRLWFGRAAAPTAPPSLCTLHPPKG